MLLGNNPRVYDITRKSHSLGTPASNRRSPPTVTYPTGFLKLATPRRAVVSPRDFNRNPYTEASYTPKRFRPEEYEKESPGDDELFNPAMICSRAWLPPEHPDELLEGEDSPISPTAVRNVHLRDITQSTYLIVVLAIGQRIHWSCTSTGPAFKHHYVRISWRGLHITKEEDNYHPSERF